MRVSFLFLFILFWIPQEMCAMNLEKSIENNAMLELVNQGENYYFGLGETINYEKALACFKAAKKCQGDLWALAIAWLQIGKSTVPVRARHEIM